MTDQGGEQDSSYRVSRRKALAAGALGVVGLGTGVSFANSTGTSSLSVSSSGSSSVANIIPTGGLDSDSSTEEFTNPVSNTGSSTPDNKSVALDDLVNESSDLTSALPSWQVAADTGGGVDTPGDIYIIEQQIDSSDLFIEVFYNNVGDLDANYNYLNLDIELHADASTSSAVQTETITLSTGRASFTIDQGSLSTGSTGDFYNLAISNGSWYTKSSIGNNLSPDFFLNVTRV